MSNRGCCNECPWKIDNKNNNNLISAILRWFSNGSRKTTEHRCHMISPNIWESATPENVCIGSKNKENGKTK